MSITQSDLFQMVCVAKITREEREGFRAFVTDRCKHGEGANDRTIREWVQCWRAATVR